MLCRIFYDRQQNAIPGTLTALSGQAAVFCPEESSLAWGACATTPRTAAVGPRGMGATTPVYRVSPVYRGMCATTPKGPRSPARWQTANAFLGCLKVGQIRWHELEALGCCRGAQRAVEGREFCTVFVDAAHRQSSGQLDCVISAKAM